MSNSASGALDDAIQMERKGDFDRAASVYRSFCDDPDPLIGCRARVRLARCCLETCKPGDTDEAEELLAEAGRTLSERDERELQGMLLLEKGRLYEHHGQLQRALQRFTEARALLEREGVDTTEVDLVLASAERRRGELNDALARLEAIERHRLPSWLGAEYDDEFGALLIARGEHKNAVGVLERALEQDEAIAGDYAAGRSRLLLAEAYMFEGERERAKALIDKAIAVYRGSSGVAGLSEAYALMGLWYEDGDDYVSAAQFYQDSYDQDRSSDDRAGMARAKRRLARTFRKRGDTERARELLNSARALLQRGDDVEMAAVLQEEGFLCLAGPDPDYDKAIKLLTRAYELVEEDGDERTTAIAKRKLARAYREGDKLEKAEDLLRQATEALRARGDARALDEVLDDLGEVLFEQDRYDEAEACLLESLRLDEQLGRIASRGRSLLLLGQVARSKGQRDRAGGYFHEGLEVFRQVEHAVGMSDAFRLLGAWYLQQGQLELAIENLREGLKIDNRLNDVLGRVRAARLLAATHRELGDLERADEYLGEAERDLAQIDDSDEHAWLEFEQGRLQLANARYKLARGHLESARSELQELGGGVDVAVCERFIALAMAYEGRYADALALLKRVGEVFEERRYLSEMCDHRLDLATVHLLSGKPSAARECVLAGLRSEHANKGRSLLLLARAAGQQHESTVAKQYIGEARECFRQLKDEVGRAEAELELGDWHTDQREFSEAISAYKQARRLEQYQRDLRGVARCDRKLAHIYIDRHEYQRAEEALEDAIANLREIDDHREMAPLEFERGRLAAGRNRHESAVSHFRKALAGYDALSQDDRRQVTYQHLVTSYQSLGETDEALECIRAMGAESIAMFNVLVKELHPEIVAASYTSFAAGEYPAAIVNAFRELELQFKRRAEGLTDPDERSVKKQILAWVQSRPQDAPSFDAQHRDHSLQSFAEFCVASFALFRNPAQHRPPSIMSPVEAFAALAVAHSIASFLDGSALLGMASGLDRRDRPGVHAGKPAEQLVPEH